MEVTGHVAIHVDEGADHRESASAVSRGENHEPLPPTREQRRHDLRLERKVWCDGALRHQSAEGA